MKRVFVGGSSRITRLNEEVRRSLDQMVDREMRILVGDANGADRAVQTWLHERGFPNVTVFYTSKDSAMAEGPGAGFMLWDGESPGTVVNVARLVGGRKSTETPPLNAEQEAEEVLTRPLEDRPGSEGSRVALGQTAAGRYLRIIYMPDHEPDSAAAAEREPACDHL